MIAILQKIRGCVLISFIIGMFLYADVIGIHDLNFQFVGHIMFILSLGFLIFDGNITLCKGERIWWGLISSILLLIGIYGALYVGHAIPFINEDSWLAEFLSTFGYLFLLLGGGSTGARALVIFVFI